MALEDVLGNLPTLNDVVPQGSGVINYGAVAPPPAQTGDGNFVTAGLGSGLHQLLGTLAQGGQAAARFAGADSIADAAARTAAAQRAAADSYARPDLEQAGWFGGPTAFAYHALQSLPSFAGMLGGAALGEAGLGALGVGAGAARVLGAIGGAYPQSVGENVERARAEGQPEQSGKALALGVPEAALMGILPAHLEAGLAGKLAGGRFGPQVGEGFLQKAARGAGIGVATQIPAAAAGEALMQQMGDPNRTLAQRSQDIVNAALAGGAQGAIFGGLIHGLAKTPPAKVSDDNLRAATDGPLGLPPSTPPEPPALPPGAPQGALPAPGTPGLEKQLQPPQRFAPEPQAPSVPPDVATPPAQPGQTIPQITDQTAPVLPGQPPRSGETIVPSPQLGVAADRANVPLAEDRTPAPTIERSGVADMPKVATADIPPPLLPENTPAHANVPLVKDRTPAVTIERASVPPAEDRSGTLVDNTAKIAEQTADIKKITKGVVPDYVKLGDDLTLKQSLFEEAQKRDENDKPLGKRLTDLLKANSLLDDDGKLVDPVAEQEKIDEAAAQPETALADTSPNADQGNPVPARTLRAGVAKEDQAKWDRLEALRKSIPDNMGFLHDQISEAQSKLGSGEPDKIAEAIQTTKDIRKAVKGTQAIERVLPAEAKAAPEAPAPKAPAAKVDETQGAKKFTPEVTAAAKTPEAPVEQKPPTKQEQVKAKQRSKNAPPSEPAAPPPAASEAKAAPAQAAEPTPLDRQMPRIAKAFKAVKDSIGSLMQAKLPARQRTIKGQIVPEAEEGVAGRNRAYQKSLDVLDQQQQTLGKLLKAKDVDALRHLDSTTFSSRPWDEFYDQADPKTQDLMDRHNKALDNLYDAINEATGANRARSEDVFSSREPTDHDQVISDMIDKGMSARDILSHIAQNGSNSMRRTMAGILLRLSKAAPDIRFGTMDEMQRDHASARHTFGDYNEALDRIRVFDKADAEHTILHEFAHAAMSKALERPEIKAAVRKLMDMASEHMTPEERIHPSMKNEHEFMSEGFANADFANFLDGIKADGSKRSIWQAFKDLVRRVLGLPKGAESLLDHVMHLGGEAMDAQNRMSGTVHDLNQTTGLFAREAQEAGDKMARAFERRLDLGGIGSKIYDAMAFWRTTDGIARGLGRYVPSALRHAQNILDHTQIKEAMSGANSATYNATHALDAKTQDLLKQLKTASALNIDPRLLRDQQKWMSQAERLRKAPEIQRYNQLWNELKKNPEAVKAYEMDNHTQRANLFAAYVAMIRELVERNNIDLGQANRLKDDPVANLVSDKTGIADDPFKSSAYFKDALTDHMNRLRHGIKDIENRIKQTTDKTEAKRLMAQRELLSSWERDATRVLTGSSEAPNFPLKRSGTHAVAGKLMLNSEKAIGRFQEALQKAGFKNVYMNHNLDSNQVYIRTQGEGQAESLREVFKQMEAENILEKGSIWSGKAEAMHTKAGVLPDHIAAMVKSIHDLFEAPADLDPALKTAYDQAAANAREQMVQNLLDILPESSTQKIFAERQGVHGFTTEMNQASLERAMNTASAIANITMSRRTAEARQSMIDEVQNLKRDTSQSVGTQSRVQRGVEELLLRDAQKQWRVQPNAFDTVKQWTHMAELGLSVPYTMMLASQSYTLGWSELLKHFGAVRSLSAITGSHAKAIQAMIGAWHGGKHAFLFTPEGLAKAGLKDKDIDLLLHQQNLGTWSQFRTQWTYDGIKHKPGIGKVLHDVSSAWSLYSEMLPRLVTAFAARDLYNERAAQGKAPIDKQYFNDMHSFVAHTVNQSQLSWLPGFNPRATGKHGVAGSASPLIEQFQGFRFKLLEKMASEFSNAMGKNGPEYQAQARKFLLGHVAAQAVLAGTMGLPLVGLFAGLYDRLADAFSGDGNTHDIKASYRNWLSDMFGGGMGEVLAHGIPRLGGIDLSSRIGEDRMAPFTEFLASHRKLEDNFADWAKGSMGSAAHLGLNMALAARDFSNGDVVEGLARGGPEFLRNIAEAKMVGDYGYTDKAGFKYPIKASTADVLKTFLGLEPENKAEYEEKSRYVEGLKEREQFDVQNIQQHLAKAFNRHDPVAYQEWMKTSQQYMLAHPGVMPPAAGFGNYLHEHARSAGIAGAQGVPLNTNPRDLLARGAVRYGNLGNQ